VAAVCQGVRVEGLWEADLYRQVSVLCGKGGGGRKAGGTWSDGT
jgi:hypothetical protein